MGEEGEQTGPFWVGKAPVVRRREQVDVVCDKSEGKSKVGSGVG